MRQNLIVPVLAFCLTAVCLFAQQTNTADGAPTARDYFLDLRKITLGGLPASFTGELTGKAIEQKLKNIPKDSYQDPAKRVYVRLSYSKKNGIRLTVQNVDELYRDLYSDLPRQIFAFDLILSSEKNQQFLNRYAFSFQSRQENLVILKLAIRSAENALMIYATPQDKKIQRIDYMLGKELLSSTIVVYQQVSGSAGKSYQVPVRFLTKTFDTPDPRPEILDIRNVKAP